MTTKGKTESQAPAESDAKFRAVVKRLLDTPPMHKTAKPARTARQPAAPKKKRS